MKLGAYEITGAALRLLMRQAANLRAGVGVGVGSLEPELVLK